MSVDSKKVRIAQGSALSLGKAKNRTLAWKDFCTLFDDPPRTSEKHRAFLKLPKPEQDRLKAIDGWYLGGGVEGGRRRRRQIAERDIITIDIDECSPEFFAEIRDGLPEVADLAYVCHTTRKHDPERPRVRMNFLLERPVDRDHYDAASRILAHRLDPTLDTVDDVSFRPAQMMFMPTCSADQEYLHWRNDGLPLDIDAMLSEWPSDWRDFINLPFSESRGQKRPPDEKAEDPWEKRGLIGAFCRAYTVQEAIAAFLPKVYAQGQEYSGKPRYTYLPGSTANGVVVEDDGRFVYSHHGTDPCSDSLCNAFDMVRLHLFGDADRDKDLTGIDVVEHPSYKRMIAFARDDRTTQAVMVEEELDIESMLDDVSDLDEQKAAENRKVYLEGTGEIEDRISAILGDDEPVLADLPPYPGSAPPPRAKKGWIKELEPTAEGKVRVSLPNIATIVMNDPRLHRVIARNVFSGRICARRPIKSKMKIVPEIEVEDPENGLEWTDEHDASIRTILEAASGQGRGGYGLRVTDRDLRDSILLVARHWRYHPVIAYLSKLEHDGKPRLETLWKDYLGCEDTPYHRETAVLFVVGAIARLFRPGHKFDWVPILMGPQGIRKSSFVSALFFGKWAGELTAEMVSNKDAVEQMLGKWVLELAELANMTRSEVEAQKAFITREEDRVRLAYDRRMSTFQRQCVFMGTTNAHEYLRDRENRRYWPLQVTKSKSNPIDTDRLVAERDQIWAEAMDRYRTMCAGHNWRSLAFGLSTEADDEARWRQDQARLESYEDQESPRIEDWLETPVRLSELETATDFDDLESKDDPLVLRVKVCAVQIGEEALSLELQGLGRRANTPRVVSEVMNSLAGWKKSRNNLRFPKYGRHRAWVREGATASEVHRGYRIYDELGGIL